MGNALHVFVDATRAAGVSGVTCRVIEGGWHLLAQRVDLILPPGAEECGASGGGGVTPVSHVGISPTRALFDALDAAAAAHASLLLLTGELVVPSEILPVLQDGLAFDPMHGTAQPLFADSRTDAVWRPWRPGEGPVGAPLDRSALLRLPPYLLTAELPSACLLVRASLVPVLAEMRVEAQARDLVGLLTLLLCRLRRRGFRNVCCTRAVVPSTLGEEVIYPLPGADRERLVEACPEHTTVRAEDACSPWARLAPLLGHHGRRSLLLDCRGLGPLHNGTSQSILGQLGGFASAEGSWDIEVLSSPQAASFHRLRENFPRFRHVATLRPEGYAAIMHMSQPWHRETLQELHPKALVLGFNILDTISWDIGFGAPAGIGEVWRLTARHADFLSFISRFTRDRFHRRFARPGHLPEAVAHLSLTPEEHVRPRWQASGIGEHVLIFGNSYDHKDVTATLDLLTRSFPLRPFVVVGGNFPSMPNARSYPSGHLTEAEVHALTSSARAIVFPSFYEGFGLPVVEGLSYGRPVLVRQSPLWEEIAAHSRLPGDLIPFADTAGLLEALGRLLGGAPVMALPRGNALLPGQPPPSWTTTALVTLDGLERALEGAADRWLERDIALAGPAK